MWSPASGSDEPWTKDKRLEDAKGNCKWKKLLCIVLKQTYAIARTFQASSLPKHLLTSYIFLQSWSCPACESGNEADTCWKMFKVFWLLETWAPGMPWYCTPPSSTLPWSHACTCMSTFFWVLIFRGAPKYKFTISCIPLQQWLLALWKGTYMPIHPQSHSHSHFASSLLFLQPFYVQSIAVRQCLGIHWRFKEETGTSADILHFCRCFWFRVRVSSLK